MFKPTTLLLIGFSLAITAATASADAKGKIAKAVSGKLVQASGKKVSDYKIDANPAYYVIYHSASW